MNNSNAVAQSILSNYCRTHGKDGNPEEKDFEGQFKWAEKAATQEYAPAFNVLGMMYNNGIYVEKNPVKALYSFQKGA